MAPEDTPPAEGKDGAPASAQPASARSGEVDRVGVSTTLQDPGLATTRPTPSGRMRIRAGATTPGPLPRPELADPLIGTLLQGRYQVTRKIGEGGMGAVYEAQHTLIGKRVAVKVLLERYAQKHDIVARLQQEARLASAIGNEHIVDITDFGETEDGRTFVVMEYLDGESLAEMLAREAPIGADRAIGIVRQVANALGAAHEKGIVHRDVKPENIFLVRRGDRDFVKVVDFGISKILRPGDEELQRLTQTGMVLGTPLYMSPEQARGEEDLDHRIDIYALGVILYEAVTGEVPFRGKNSLVIINQVLGADPKSPRELRPDLGISEALEAVILHAMAKDRRRRYQSMAELEADLARLQAGELDVGPALRSTFASVTTGRFARRAGERWVQLVVLGLVIAAVFAGVQIAIRRTQPPTVAAQSRAPGAPAPAVRPTPPANAAPPPSRLVALTIRSDPTEADLYFKGPGDADYHHVGKTPISFNVPASSDRGFLEVEKAGFEPVVDRVIDLTHNEPGLLVSLTPARAAANPKHPSGTNASQQAAPAPAGTNDVSTTFRPR